jgi:hypothetical protein
MDTKEREAFYDAEIAPALLALGKKCQDSGLSFLAVVEWEPGETGRTSCFAEGAGIGMRMTETAAKAAGNIDSFMFAMMRHAREHGHSSMCLAQLGVPTKPEAVA